MYYIIYVKLFSKRGWKKVSAADLEATVRDLKKQACFVLDILPVSRTTREGNYFRCNCPIKGLKAYKVA